MSISWSHLIQFTGIVYSRLMPYKDKTDQLAAQRRHYQKNSENIKARTRVTNQKLRKRNREYVENLKASTPCSDCGNTYPSYVMQFDHIIDDKRGNVANLVRSSFSLEVIQAEIDKCELVCANCHAERTFSRIREAEENLEEWL